MNRQNTLIVLFKLKQDLYPQYWFQCLVPYLFKDEEEGLEEGELEEGELEGLLADQALPVHSLTSYLAIWVPVDSAKATKHTVSWFDPSR